MINIEHRSITFEKLSSSAEQSPIMFIHRYRPPGILFQFIVCCVSKYMHIEKYRRTLERTVFASDGSLSKRLFSFYYFLFALFMFLFCVLFWFVSFPMKCMHTNLHPSSWYATFYSNVFINKNFSYHNECSKSFAIRLFRIYYNSVLYRS